MSRASISGVLAVGTMLHLAACATGGDVDPSADMAASDDHPFGRLNREAPPETSQYAFMIGLFECDLTYRSYQDGDWVVSQEGRASWSARYIMDGRAVLDEFRDDLGNENINARVYDPEAGHWIIQYATVSPPAAASLVANQVGERMVMITPREAPGGIEYIERVAFEPQGDDAYRWTQEVVFSETSSVVIGELNCVRQ